MSESFHVNFSFSGPVILEKKIFFGLLVLEKKIFKNFQCIFTLLPLSPLGEGQSPSFEQT
jgi:hypothetical protein